ncbi:hypothetical protein [Thalassospira mesophila]|uniref:Uncharacterized protein n=1 Tax=Thalassospira mesophila TaxID=1293891 RepID=A0A1Y2L1X0_9PROT|nr:hypothetical protein [Thalassospira mesophila]OSQ38927.1 hypothetical protein TMES_09380 [Thalassospira mesophila]
MRVIKILVAVMAVLIVAGIALVAYGLQREKSAKQTSSLTEQTVAPVAAPGNSTGTVPTATTSDKTASQVAKAPSVASTDLEPFGTLNVDLAADETLTDFKIDDNRAFLHLTGPKGARIVVVSLVDKSVLGQIVVMKPN